MKTLIKSALLASGILFLLACQSKQAGGSPAHFPDSVTVTWQHITNQYQGESLHLAELTLINEGSVPLKNEGWSFYFNWFRRPDTTRLDRRIRARHINGDFYEIKPTTIFPTLNPGDVVTIPVVGSHYELNITDTPSGAYFVSEHNGETYIVTTNIQIQPFNKSRLFRSERDIVPVWTPVHQYAVNEQADPAPMEATSPDIVPTPVSAEFKGRLVELSGNWNLQYDKACSEEAAWFQNELNSVLPEFPSQDSGKTIMLTISPESFSGDASRNEAYRLEVGDELVQITGYDAAGAFYGLQTLLGIATGHNTETNAIMLPVCTVLDYPRFAYRGMHIDVARNFQDAKTIEQVVDELARIKLNRLHFHLTDDEGWRLEIPGLPELTQIGAIRGHTVKEKEHLVPSLGSGPYTDPDISMGSGFYTREAFIELLKYADQRHIEIIPEIDLPGHAHAAIVSMDYRYRRLLAGGNEEKAREYLLYHPEDTSSYKSVQNWKNNVVDVGMESTYRFFEKVVMEIRKMYEDAGIKLTMLHIGGDEVPSEAWSGSPVAAALMKSNKGIKTHHDLFSYFVSRCGKILDSYDIRAAGWEEIGMKFSNGKKVPNEEFVDRGFVPYVWNSVWGWGGEDLAYRLANEGFDVVLSSVTNLYFDIAYHKHPQEPGLYWGGFVSTRNAWEFTPTDVTLCAETDLYGHPIDVEAFDRFQPLKSGAEPHIIGMQGQVWGENARSKRMLHFLMFPKALGLAERAWTPEPVWEKRKALQEREADWNRFLSVLGKKIFPGLSERGIMYRVPLPGAKVENGKLYMNNRFPGLIPMYQINTGEEIEFTGPAVVPVDEETTITIWNRDASGHVSRKEEL